MAKSKKDDGLHGADRLPCGLIARVKKLIMAGEIKEASRQLEAAAVAFGLKSYEVHQLAGHLQKECHGRRPPETTYRTTA